MKELSQSTSKMLPSLLKIDLQPFEQERWKGLIEVKKFDNEKAMLSMRCEPKDLRLIKPKHVKEVFLGLTPSLATIKKYRGNDKMEDTLTLLLMGLNDNINTKAKLSDSNISLLVELVFDDYFFFTLTDLKLCFKKALSGKYGKIYERVGVDTVMEWVAKHNEERLIEGQKITTLKNEKAEKEGKRYFDKKIVDKMLEMLEKKALKERVERIDKNFKYQKIEDWCSVNNIEPLKYLQNLKQEWQSIYDSDIENERFTLEQFFQFQYQRKLLELNDKARKV